MTEKADQFQPDTDHLGALSEQIESESINAAAEAGEVGILNGATAPPSDHRPSPVPTLGFTMLTQMTSGFIARLRANDEAAWFELWETFGPVLRAQLTKWGKGRIGAETVRDLSQETLAALSNSIERYDPNRGARFSTWLLAIARHVLGDEIDRRSALKRGGGKPNAELDESWMKAAPGQAADAAYEAAVFRAKVEAAIRLAEKECDFMDFSIYRMRVFDGLSGKDCAGQLGVSEPTISRRLTKVREHLRIKLSEVVTKFSFTEEELAEPGRNGLLVDPNNPPAGGIDKSVDQAFDEALADIYLRQMELRAADEQGFTGP